MMVAEMNSKGVLLEIDNFVKAADRHSKTGLMDVALEVMRLSQFEVPHDEGTLQNSGAVEEIRGTIVAGYHTAYAARLHEHPEYRFQKGRKGKYLEDPIIKNTNTLGLVFGRGVQTRLF